VTIAVPELSKAICGLTMMFGKLPKVVQRLTKLGGKGAKEVCGGGTAIGIGYTILEKCWRCPTRRALRHFFLTKSPAPGNLAFFYLTHSKILVNGLDVSSAPFRE